MPAEAAGLGAVAPPPGGAGGAAASGGKPVDPTGNQLASHYAAVDRLALTSFAALLPRRRPGPVAAADSFRLQEGDCAHASPRHAAVVSLLLLVVF